MELRTKADFAAAYQRQLEENAALRDLIAAAAACADVPIAAPGYHGQDDRLAWRRTVKIHASLAHIDYGMDYLCAVLAGTAESLRETAAEPVTYEVYQPEDDVQDGGQ